MTQTAEWGKLANKPSYTSTLFETSDRGQPVKRLRHHEYEVFVLSLSDSGPLRLARTPSPPEDESPPESPDASTNHMLRPISPGPPRPKSPTQVHQILFSPDPNNNRI